MSSAIAATKCEQRESSDDEEEDIDLSGWNIHEIEEHYYRLNTPEKGEVSTTFQQGDATACKERGVIKVKCCPELTPYDAVLLAEGEDLTGNRVRLWALVV